MSSSDSSPRAWSFAIVEDDARYRAEVVAWIDRQPGWRCRVACARFEEALAEVPKANPDLVLLDIQLADGAKNVRPSGLELVPKFNVLLPNSRLVMLTVMDDLDVVLQAIQAGAVGYIQKGAPGPRLLEQIQTILDGGAYMSPAIARQVAEWFRIHRPSDSVSGLRLTAREWEILGLTARGRTQELAAKELGIEVSTIRNHFQSIYRKMRLEPGHKTVAAAVYRAAPSLRIREMLQRTKPPGRS